MADNYTVPIGTTTSTVASDDISGVHHPKVKIEYGDSDSATQVSTASPLPVTQQTLGAGEDLTNNVLGVILRPVTSSSYSPYNYKDKGTVTKAFIKASAGSVFSLRVTNTNAAVRYFQLHNKATAPVAADTASRYFLIPAGTATAPGVLSLDNTYFSPSWYLGTGISWAISTTSDTFTDSATAGEHTYDINYV